MASSFEIKSTRPSVGETIVTIVRDHIDYRKQIFKLAGSDLRRTYRASALGWSWAIIKPLVTIFVYWFAFAVGLRRGGEAAVARRPPAEQPGIGRIAGDLPEVCTRCAVPAAGNERDLGALTGQRAERALNETLGTAERVVALTNDGDLASKLTHPSFKKKKIYHVWLDKNVSIEDMEKIANGLELEDGEIHADAISYASEDDKSQVGIEIHSGRNRIVRRIFESLGYHVVKLDRVYFAGLTKKNLGRGKWRYLNEREVNALRMGAFE